MGHAERVNAAGLAKRLSDARAMNAHYLRALAALLVERDGEIRIPLATLALLDDDMVVRQEIDEDTKEVVLRLKVPPSQEASH